MARKIYWLSRSLAVKSRSRLFIIVRDPPSTIVTLSVNCVDIKKKYIKKGGRGKNERISRSVWTKCRIKPRRWTNKIDESRFTRSLTNKRAKKSSTWCINSIRDSDQSLNLNNLYIPCSIEGVRAIVMILFGSDNTQHTMKHFFSLSLSHTFVKAT